MSHKYIKLVQLYQEPSHSFCLRLHKTAEGSICTHLIWIVRVVCEETWSQGEDLAAAPRHGGHLAVEQGWHERRRNDLDVGEGATLERQHACPVGVFVVLVPHPARVEWVRQAHIELRSYEVAHSELPLETCTYLLKFFYTCEGAV